MTVIVMSTLCPSSRESTVLEKVTISLSEPCRANTEEEPLKEKSGISSNPLILGGPNAAAKNKSSRATITTAARRMLRVTD